MTTNTAAINPALQNMKDIHTPDPIGLWPLASGYWLLIVLAIILIVGIFLLIRRYVKQTAPKKAAMNALNNINTSGENCAVEINAVLKRAAMSYISRATVASSDGEEWHQWLDKSLPDNMQGKFAALLNKRYQKDGLTTQENIELMELAKFWLNKALPMKPEAIC
ncbi:DUF4381 domain-containing protein [Parashewanella spongiae]|uniref:DUF4381 domain-containing protein n=1 Tax=Parashewanella spongiae TaxID=342950 RepID=A0A3A6TSJ1_9GAMM|nr:DUF4381 domain-containing protein [Parashewanella spongiae]MCL1076892.1 DUF4381 domain-containing protein [Parashewanella spongiae]RJY19142.1 DUF4381 domain-containing protein [Parashewanella spongiae]